MTATRLVQKRVAKVWGRRDLPPIFEEAGASADAIGEIWFEHPDGRDVELLVKFLFTSERLSIQVHPDDVAAREAGLTRGKDEAWVLLQAGPGAELGIGLTKELSAQELSLAAQDGSIESILDWRPATAGEVYYSPAGTIHALGAGLALVEIQQNCDVTYRLFDYGRPRELHLEAGVAVAHRRPYRPPGAPYEVSDGREILANGRAFVLERWSGAREGPLRPQAGRPLWIVPLAGTGELGALALDPGNAFLVDEPCLIRLDAACELLVAYPGSEVEGGLLG